ncbi:hypothetical protein PF007_g3609 [Phytophthora fragariae]|uniref:Pectate lyase n=1 Tax=Phytophthora fragariae TaxID=53985 RepID=A0A6A3DV30_9STRA|nr:hypothetical protein PF009_g24305 [Phytophthora fragariae]KAE9132704.1 hypothetical protein PF007_g3609 [Phytophthora fragariae]KAE9152748.1 hypothetical protein PF006_g3057 [Phytophthora fragariae]
MKFIATLSIVAALAAMDSIAVTSDADPANAPIYYGRPNNGGYTHACTSSDAAERKQHCNAHSCKRADLLRQTQQWWLSLYALAPKTLSIAYSNTPPQLRVSGPRDCDFSCVLLVRLQRL